MAKKKTAGHCQTVKDKKKNLIFQHDNDIKATNQKKSQQKNFELQPLRIADANSDLRSIKKPVKLFLKGCAQEIPSQFFCLPNLDKSTPKLLAYATAGGSARMSSQTPTIG